MTLTTTVTVTMTMTTTMTTTVTMTVALSKPICQSQGQMNYDLAEANRREREMFGVDCDGNNNII